MPTPGSPTQMSLALWQCCRAHSVEVEVEVEVETAVLSPALLLLLLLALALALAPPLAVDGRARVCCAGAGARGFSGSSGLGDRLLLLLLLLLPPAAVAAAAAAAVGGSVPSGFLPAAAAEAEAAEAEAAEVEEEEEEPLLWSLRLPLLLRARLLRSESRSSSNT